MVSLVWMAATAQQHPPFQTYQKEAGNKAALYYGKREMGYSSRLYKGHPYRGTDEFRSGEVCFDDNLYTDVLLRYDAYTKQLVVQTPNKPLNVKADMRKVSYFTLDGMKYVPQGNSFAALLYEGERLTLLELYSCGKGAPVIEAGRSYATFKQSTRYVLQVEGKSYTVGSRASFIKLFPAHKQELNDYAKAQGLNFGSGRAEALKALTAYTETILKE